MKKKVKSLIVAASVAAIAGIAAVSFAYWNAGSGRQQGAASGGTGNAVAAAGAGLTVSYVGDETLTTTAENGSFEVEKYKLIPYDQKDGIGGHAGLIGPEAGETWQNVHYMVFNVAYGGDTSNGVTYKISGGLTGTEENPVGSAKLMYKVGEPTVSGDDADVDSATGALKSREGFTDITNASTAIKGWPAADSENPNEAKITVILVANGADAKNVTWNLLFSVTENTGLAATGYDMKANGTLKANLEEVKASAGEKVVYCASSVELQANDVLTFDVVGANTGTVKGDGDDGVEAGFATVTGSQVKVTADGTYNVYFKQYNTPKGDDAAGTWYVWVEYKPSDDRVSCSTGGYLVGQFENDPAFVWDYGFAMEVQKNADGTIKQYVITKTLTANQVIKFRIGGTGYGYHAMEEDAPVYANFAAAESDDNIKVTTGGTYTFYLKTDGSIWVVNG